MALSGTINGSVTNLDSHFSFYMTWSAVQSISGNYSDVTATTFWSTDNTAYTFDTTGKRSAGITINGSTESISQRFDCNPWNSNGIFEIQTHTVRVNHNSDGTKSITISARANGYASSYGPSNSSSSSGDCTASGTITLNTIPRYASITQSMSSRTETSIAINWTTDATVDQLWYSTNNGTSYTQVSIANSTSGSYTITGLSAYTNYKIKTKVRRKDSQLTSESTALSVYTYPYPYANNFPDFVIGNTLTIGIYNPLGRTVTVEALGADNSVIGSGTTSGTSIAGYKTSGMITNWYASIPNAQSGTYKVRVTYSGNANTKTGGTYTVNTSVCAPVIGSVTYADVNSTITAITQNNKNIVRSHSTVRYTASSLSARYSATLASASVSVNGLTYSMTISGSSATGGNASIDSASNVTATVTLRDSRGLAVTKNVTVTMLDWTLPSAIITMARQSNYYSATDIKVDASYSSVDGKNTITIQYKARQQGTSSWTVTGTLSDNVTATFTADNEYAWDVQVILTDRFGGTTTYNLTLNRGMPIIYFDRKKSSVSVNKFPEISGGFEVGGNIRATKTDSSATETRVTNSVGSTALHVSTAGNAGVYNHTYGKWTIYEDTSGHTNISDKTLLVNSLSGSSATLPTNSGRVFRSDYNGAQTVTVPSGLPVGYEAYITPYYMGGRITLQASGSEVFATADSTEKTTLTIPIQWSFIHLIKVHNSRWFVDWSAPTYYTAGDVLTTQDVRLGAGFVTTSSTELAFDLPLAKPLLGVSSATFTTMTGHCRSSLGGYLQYYDGSTYTNLYNTSWLSLYDSITVTPYTGHIYVQMMCNSKWGRNSATVTNNSTVVAQFSSLSITLA